MITTNDRNYFIIIKMTVKIDPGLEFYCNALHITHTNQDHIFWKICFTKKMNSKNKGR